MTDINVEQSENKNNNEEQTSAASKNNNDGVLTEEIKAELPQEAQQIFAAAFKAAQSDGISEEGARQVAWNSVKNQYEKGADGKWHSKGEVTAQHHKAVTSGGN
ncbi:MAG: cation transport regulator ChaB [Hapalosiphonaceae cyanobacterium JJU2]|nr:MAG: cation transport regulator ChaB [Hapalosiphonaceae cyanobacterium JJU2]